MCVCQAIVTTPTYVVLQYIIIIHHSAADDTHRAHCSAKGDKRTLHKNLIHGRGKLNAR